MIAIQKMTDSMIEEARRIYKEKTGGRQGVIS